MPDLDVLLMVVLIGFPWVVLLHDSISKTYIWSVCRNKCVHIFWKKTK